jgi:hypothetical protein
MIWRLLAARWLWYPEALLFLFFVKTSIETERG